VTAEEALALAAQVKQGRTLEVKWDGPDSYCCLVVRHDAERGLVGRYDEIPYDVLTPWPETATRTWNEAELVELLTNFPNGTAELTT
jgi:hypothetical protein